MRGICIVMVLCMVAVVDVGIGRSLRKMDVKGMAKFGKSFYLRCCLVHANMDQV